MANVLGGGGGGGDGLMGQFPLEQWFYEMPVCTRWWMTAALSASVLVQCRIISPFQLFYSFRTVFYRSQYWRLLTTFFYFGPLSLDLLYHIFFLQRYSRLLEESSGRSPAHFSWLLAFASAALLCIAPMFSMAFLGSALSSTLIYIWSRKNQDTMLSFLGLIVFKAPYLPWVLLCFSLIMHGSVPKDECCGIVVGHVWYFFNDVYPPLHNGHSPLDPPAWWIRLFDGPQDMGVEGEEEGDAEGEGGLDQQEDAPTGVGARDEGLEHDRAEQRRHHRAVHGERDQRPPVENEARE